MTFAAVFDGRDVPISKYDQAVAAGGPEVYAQPARTSHVCYESGNGFVVVDVWESEEAFAAFGESVIGPALASIGVDLVPQMHRVHNVMGSAASPNVTTVGELYAAFGRGDIPTIIGHLAEDVQWEEGSDGSHGVPWLQPGRGKDHVAGFFSTLSDMEFKRFDVLSVAGDGNRVIALIELETVWVPTGGSIRDIEAHVWTFGDDGLVHSFRHLVDTAQHARAAGV